MTEIQKCCKTCREHNANGTCLIENMGRVVVHDMDEGFELDFLQEGDIASFMPNNPDEFYCANYK